MFHAVLIPASLWEHQSHLLHLPLLGSGFQRVLLDHRLLHLCLSVHAGRSRMGQEHCGRALHRIQHAVRFNCGNQHRHRRGHPDSPRAHDLVIAIVQASKACHYWGVFFGRLVSIPSNIVILTYLDGH